MARTRTLTELIAEAKQRADMENSTFVSTAEVTRYINQSIAKLYNKLVHARGDEYYLQRIDFTTTSGEALYALPSNFYKLVGLDINYGGSVITATPLMFQAERNMYQDVRGWDQYNWPVKYMIQSQYLRVFPAPQGEYTCTLWYVPHAPELGRTGVVDANFAYTSGSYKLTLTGGTDTTTSVALSANETLGYLFQGSKLNFSSPPFTEAPRITKVEGTTIFLDRPTEASGSDSDISVDNPDRWDGISGWEDYVVLDTAIRLMVKEESDPSALMAEKQEMDLAIEELGSERDDGSPKTIQDVMRPSRYFDDEIYRR